MYQNLTQKADSIRVMNELENALLEYVERFGATEKARTALRLIDLFRKL